MSADRCDLLCLDLPMAEAIRARQPERRVVELAAGRAKALGDPTRLALAAALADADELCVCDLAWISGRPENLVSHHVRALRSAGVATSRRDGKMILYALSPLGRELVQAVLGLPVERS
jgi:DNA-binding transcriptional ArsR family regulator